MITKRQRDNVIHEVSLISSSKNLQTLQQLRIAFLCLSISPCNIIEKEVKGRVHVSTYVASSTRVKPVREKLMRLKLPGVSVCVRNIQKKDWQDKWKRDFCIFRLTKTIDVVPLWLRSKYREKKRRPIVIDTTSAFGTGMHETTRFMAQLIESQKGKFRSFLDVGTGTGILSMVALICGAKKSKVIAIDSDPESLKVARNNLLLNGYSSVKIKSIDVKNLVFSEAFDFVAANLLSQDLINLRQKLFSLVKKDGYLAISGISHENATGVKSVFKKLRLRCVKIFKGKDWQAFLYKKT